MVTLAASVAPARSRTALAIFPVAIAGLAFACAAVPLICVSSLTVLCSAHKADHEAAFRLAIPRPLLSSDLRNVGAARLATVRDQASRSVQLASLELRLPAAPPLLRRDLRSRLAVALANVPSSPPQGLQFIRFSAPTLAPMAFTQFCLKYPADCKTPRLSRGERIELNATRWSELEAVNRAVNSSIHPERNEDGLAGERWLLEPPRGDCNDYAVTKRHQLMARGWPARDLLLSEVVTRTGEHHLVTVVRTSSGDLVLDNLTNQIVPWSHTRYRWVRIQTPRNPNYWASVANQSA